jgi:hypothetical protein
MFFSSFHKTFLILSVFYFDPTIKDWLKYAESVKQASVLKGLKLLIILILTIYV